MSLTDLMSGFNLAFYAQVALVVFFLVFVAVVVHVWRRPKDEITHDADLPLDDAPIKKTGSDEADPQENQQ